MDLDKTVEFLTRYVSDISAVVVVTLAHPTSRFKADQGSSGATVLELMDVPTGDAKQWVHPRLLVVSLACIAIGATVTSLVPGRDPRVLAASVILTFIWWFLYGSVLFGLCRLMRGKGSYVETLSVVLQVLAAIYVTASVGGLILALVLTNDVVAGMIASVPVLGWLGANPRYTYVALSIPLSAVYLPLALRAIHGLGVVRTVAIAVLGPIVTATTVAVLVLPYAN